MTDSKPYRNYSSPISIYIVWHPLYTEGAEYFKSLYSLLCRNVEQPLQRGIEISIYLRSAPAGEAGWPAGIPWGESDRNYIVLLVDDNMFLDEEWHRYIKGSLLHGTVTNRKILPVALTSNAFGMLNELGKPNFVRLYELPGGSPEELFNKRFHKLGTELMQGLISWLKAGKDQGPANHPEPTKVKLFLSHAKADGRDIAHDFMMHVRSNATLNTFFDANDMPYGEDFPEHIKQELKHSVVVVFHTDTYATREWCMNEVLWAKRYMAPVLVVNYIQKSEARSFPYMGNGPVLRLKESGGNFDEIIKEALFLALRNLYAHHQVNKYAALYWKKERVPLALGNAPELLHFEGFLQYVEKEKLDEIFVIYPDPPLGYEENRLLKNVNAKIRFITPLTLSKLTTADECQKRD